MKRYLKLILMLLSLTLILTAVHGQTTYKEAEKMLKGKAFKDARKEAKKWQKKGYDNLPGDFSLEKQFEQSMVKQLLLDEEGSNLYFNIGINPN